MATFGTPSSVVSAIDKATAVGARAFKVLGRKLATARRLLAPPPRRRIGTLRRRWELRQLFVVDRDGLGAIRLSLVADARPAGGSVDLSLFRAPADMAVANLGAPLCTLRLPGEQLAGEDAIDWLLPPAVTQAGDHLLLIVAASGGWMRTAVSLWASSGADRIPGHVGARLGRSDLGRYGVAAELKYAPIEPDCNVPRSPLYSPLTQCNLNCIHCISRETRKTVSRLPPAIKDQVRHWAATGQLVSMNTDYSGDLLWADSRFGGELDFVIGLDIPFQVDTNGVHLTAEVAQKLCRSRATHVNVSLDAAENETYQRVRRGAPPLQEVLDNVATLVRIRAAQGGGFRVMLGFTLMTSTLHEWEPFIRMTADVGADGINSSHLHAYTADMEPESLWNTPQAYNAARSRAIELARALGLALGAPPPFHPVAEIGHRFCPAPWESAVVLGNGDVAACCVPGTVMGNLHHESMEAIWTGPRYRALRATVNSATPPEPCSICPTLK